MSPTRFHNSVHNAAAGYWTIGAGCMQADDRDQRVRRELRRKACSKRWRNSPAGSDAVLLVGYDSAAAGPLASVSRSDGLLGGALVLSRHAREGAPRLRVELVDARRAEPRRGALARLAGGNAMAPMLPLFEALAERRRRRRAARRAAAARCAWRSQP